MRILDEYINEIEINKSRFICFLKRIETDEDAKEYLKSIRRIHPKATHHCSAILISDEVQRSSDDGEPAGTAGVPMLEVLRKRKMELIVAVVVRYFGGVMLGAGGLIRAYSKSVSTALDNCTIYDVIMLNSYKILFSYEYIDKIEYLLKEELITEKNYDVDVSYSFSSNNITLINKISEITNGQAIIEELPSRLIETPIKGEDND